MARDFAFEPAPKVNVSHRTVPVIETLARARTIARRVPITRVSDLTPLDSLHLPVFSATTPLARDLTTHMGKGLDAESAEVSAIMEAIERVSAECVQRPTVHASFQAMVARVPCAIDPRTFDLPDDTSYRGDDAISWVDGWDLLQDEPVWIPADLAINPPDDGVLQDVDTNGLAAGNTLLEAVVHGLCEVIERDAVGALLFRSLFADADERASDTRSLMPETLPDESRRWRARIDASGLGLETALVDSDVGIPVFRSVVLDPGYPSSGDERVRKFVGFGAGPNAALAVMRSISEAVQSRLAVIQGARDSFNTLSPPARRSAPHFYHADLEAHGQMPFASVHTFSSSDLLDDLQHILSRLRDAGFSRVIAVNLTRADFEVPVVRVRVPGLTSFAVNRQRIGWRCLRHLL